MRRRRPLHRILNSVIPSPRIRLTVGSTGIGSTAHLAREAVLAREGVRYIHVPYKGTPTRCSRWRRRRYPQPEYLDTADYGRFVQEVTVRERGMLARLGLGVPQPE